MDEAAVLDRLGRPEAASAIAAEAAARWAFNVAQWGDLNVPRFPVSLWPSANTDGSEIPGERILAQGWLHGPKAHIGLVSDMSAYRIGEHVWCAATVRWLLTGLTLREGELRIVLAGCAWETRVLLSPTNPESQLTILRSCPPTPLGAEEFQGLTDDPAALSVPPDTDGPRANLWRQLANMGQGKSPTVLESAAVAVALWTASRKSE